jgi:hypothetical protein
MLIIPAWIRRRDETGVWAVLGSQPPADAPERFIPAAEIESVVTHEGETGFGMLILRHGDCIKATEEKR